ncbi:MAG: DNA internalization-related competence protein ComEC/Rec2, partial [Oceanococcaceae bacterium]
LVLLHAAAAMTQRLSAQVVAPETRTNVPLRIVSVHAPAERPGPLRVVARDEHGLLLRLNDWKSPAEALPRGRLICADLRLRPPQGSVNFHGFDYGRWLYAEGVAATGTLRAVRSCADAADATHARTAQPATRLITPGAGEQMAYPSASSSPWEGIADSPGRSLLQALLVADREGFTPEIWDTLARTGTSHLFAISGLHVGLIATAAVLLGRLVWLLIPAVQLRWSRTRFALVIAVMAVLGYMVLAHAQVSAQRAGICALLVLTLWLSGRRVDPLAGWSWALLVVLLVNPFVVLGPALCLSFVAALILLSIVPRIRVRPVWQQLLIIQLGLSIVMLPWVLFWFGQASVAGLALNLLLVPAMAVFLPLGLLVLLLAWLGEVSGLQLAIAVLDRLYQVLEQIAAQPLSAWVVPVRFPFLALLSGVLSVVACSRTRWRAQAMLGGVAAVALALAVRPVAAPDHGAARLWVLDVGQGQAIVMQTARHWVVVDAGPRAPQGRFDAGAMIVHPHLQFHGARRIDLLVVSHGDLDHDGGTAAVLARYPVRKRWGHGGASCESSRIWKADGVTVRSIPLGASPAWSGNERSCVVEVRVRGQRVLLTGDIESRAEAAFVARGGATAGPYALVSVPHHGSNSSSSAAFIRHVDAGLAVVSAGRHNRWDFPRPEVQQRWSAAGVELRGTHAGGAIRIDLPAMTISRPAPRPWWRPDSAHTAPWP